MNLEYLLSMLTNFNICNSRIFHLVFQHISLVLFRPIFRYFSLVSSTVPIILFRRSSVHLLLFSCSPSRLISPMEPQSIIHNERTLIDAYSHCVLGRRRNEKKPGRFLLLKISRCFRQSSFA